MDPSQLSDADIAQMSDSDLLAAIAHLQGQGSAKGTDASVDAYNLAGSIGKGLTFGYFDEAEAGLHAAGNTLLNALGYGTGKSFNDTYDAKIAQSRADDAAFEAAHPYVSGAANLAGAVLPAVASGGLSAAGAAPRVGSGVLSTLGKYTMGVGIEGAPSALELAGMGASGGALSGAGSGDGVGDRLMRALTGGGVGAIAAPILGKALEYGTKAAANVGSVLYGAPIGDAVPGGSERGAIMFGREPTRESYTPADLLLAKNLREVAPEKLDAAATELALAADSNAPLYLPEAVNSAKVERNARFIANYEPSMDFAQQQIRQRAAGAEGRATELFDAVSAQRNTPEGAKALIEGANEILTGAERARTAATSPIYQRAFEQTPAIRDPELYAFIGNDKAVQRAIRTVQQTANNAELPVTSPELLIKVRGEIWDKVEAAKRDGWTTQARDLKETYDTLNSFLKRVPGLANADTEYIKYSAGVNELKDSALDRLRKITDDKITNIKQIFDLPPNRIEDLRGSFDKAGKLDEWNAGIRAHLQTVVEGSKDGSNFASKLIGSTLGEKKLQAALGDSYDRVSSGLHFENRFFEGRNKYHAGSSTAGNLAESSDFHRDASLITKLAKGDVGGLLMAVLGRNPSEQTAQDLARYYFTTDGGNEALSKVLPLVRAYQRNARIGGALGQGGGIAGSRLLSALQGGE